MINKIFSIFSLIFLHKFFQGYFLDFFPKNFQEFFEVDRLYHHDPHYN